MAWSYVHSTDLLNGFDGAKIYYHLKTALIAKGWTVVASGDGLSAYAAGSDVISSGNTGANGYDNTRAWICLQQPTGGSGNFAGSRQICLQVGEDGDDSKYRTRVVYSPGGTAVLTSCDANTCPTFSDEVILLGGGTAASPTFANHTTSDFGAGKVHIITGGTAENFGFFMTHAQATAPNNGFSLCFDPLTSVLAGDTEPFAFLVSSQSTPFTIQTLYDDTAYVMALYATGGYQNSSLSPSPLVSGVASTMTADGRNSKDILYPVIYHRHSTNGGFKGVSSFFRHTAVNRADRSTYTVNTAGDRVKFGSGAFILVIAPWDNTVP
jgi:hypothetical protein